MVHKRALGVGTLFLATAIYGFYGIYARLIATEFDVFTQNWSRNLIVICIATLLLILFKKHWHKIKKTDAPWIALWIVCDILFVIALFISFNSLTIGTALFLLFAGSTITGFLAGTFLLKEKITATKLVAITISLLGLLIIYGDQILTTNFFLLLLGLLTGILTGFWYVIPKKISESYPKLQLIILSAGGIFLVNVFLGALFHQTIPPLSLSYAWFGIILYGFSQIIGDFLLIKGSRLVDTHIGSLILPFEAIFGVLFAFLLFKETIPVATIFGGILIIIGALLPNITYHFRKYKALL